MEQKLRVCALMQHTAEVHMTSQMSGNRSSGHVRVRISVSSEPSGVDVCCFLSPIWTVSHTCQTHRCMNARLGSHSLNQPPAARACVDVC